MPESPVKEVALTCFAEASYGCDEGDKEKRAITDVIYNRVNANERMWGYNTVTGVLSKKISFWASIRVFFLFYAFKAFNIIILF